MSLMNRPGRLFSAAVLLASTLFLPYKASAIDFGFTLNNRTVMKYDQGSSHPLHAEQKDLFSIWVSHYFKEDFYFLAKGHLEIGTEYDSLLDGYKFLPTGDIDRLVIGGKIALKDSKANYFGFQVGRMFLSDFTNELVFTPMDGFTLSAGFDDLELEFSAGYTGLVYDWSSTFQMSYNDAVLDQDWSGSVNPTNSERFQNVKKYSAWHGPPRFLGNLMLKAPSLFKGQDLYVNLLAQGDLWGQLGENVTQKGAVDPNNAGGSPVHTVYAGLGLKGAITSAFYYNFFSYFGTGAYYEYLPDSGSATGYSYQTQAITSGMLGLDLEGFIRKALYSRVKFSFRYASGEDGNEDFYGMTSNGNSSTLFLPLNIKQSNMVFNPLFSNLMTFGLNYTFKPFSKSSNEYMKHFMVGAEFKSFLRASNSAISEQSIMTDDTSWYVGSELDILLNLISISDFNLFLSTGVFFPNEAAFTTGYENPRLEAELNFTISL